MSSVMSKNRRLHRSTVGTVVDSNTRISSSNLVLDNSNLSTKSPIKKNFNIQN